jgi:uncharacterized membrane protein YfcA
MPIEWMPATVPQLAYGMTVVLLAGVVRGFAGFGFSAFTVAGMSLFLSPAQIVPAVFVLEVLASVSLLRSVHTQIHWGWLRPLLLGNAVAIPLGVWLLAVVPEGPLRAIVSLAILSAVMLLLSGFKAPWSDTPGLRLGTGFVSGIFNGLAAIGGMAVAVMLFTAAISGAAARATLIALFFATDLYSLAWAGGNGLLDATLLRWVAWLLVPMLAGIAIGRRRFLRVDDAGFRRGVLRVLAVMAGLGLARAGWQ